MADPKSKFTKKDKTPDFNGRIVRRGGKWAALADDRKTVLGTHPTFREAVKQLQAVIIQRLKSKGKFGK